MKVRKGTVCFVNTENIATPTRLSIAMDKDRDLEIGDRFVWFEDRSAKFHCKYIVIGFVSFCPVLLDEDDLFIE